MSEPKTDPLNHFRGPLIAVGGMLVLIGAFMLLYMALLVYQVINAPEKVAIVQFVLEHVRVGDLAAYGWMQDIRTQQNIKFEFNLSESIRSLSFVLIGITILGILSGILGLLVSSGVKIIKVAMLSLPANNENK